MPTRGGSRSSQRCQDSESFRRALTAGRAKAGLLIPPNYTDRLVRGEQVQVQVLIDGSDSQVATTAMNTAKLLGLNMSIHLAREKEESLQIASARDPAGRAALAIDMRPRLLYNPNLESSHFFVPGLIGIILQLVTLFLTSFAVVRERELGTLEQLFVTPVGRTGLLLGKLVPYALVGFVEMLIVMCVMVYVFGVPIHGSLTLLLSLSMLFMVCSLGLGLLVSTVAKSQIEAVQFAFVIMLPSVLLSGFVFPRSEMPLADLRDHVRHPGDVLHRDPARRRAARRRLHRLAAPDAVPGHVLRRHPEPERVPVPQAVGVTGSPSHSPQRATHGHRVWPSPSRINGCARTPRAKVS